MARTLLHSMVGAGCGLVLLGVGLGIHHQYQQPRQSVLEQYLSVEDDMGVYARYIVPFEGVRTRMYDARPHDPSRIERTIGVGHHLDRGDSREVFERVLPHIIYDDIYSGRTSLTLEEVAILFSADLPQYVDQARRLITDFYLYPVDMQATFVDMAYRGDLIQSPRTRSLLNQARFKESQGYYQEAAQLYRSASVELVNRNDYRNAARNNMRGIIHRLDSHRRIWRKHATVLESK